MLSRVNQQDWRLFSPSSQNILETLARPVFFHTESIEAGTCVEEHAHSWWQFSFAREGLMHVQTKAMTVTLPPQYGVWVPPDCAHMQLASGKMKLESLFIKDAAITMRDRSLRVVMVDDFVRAFIHHGCTHIPALYDESGAQGRQVAVLLDLVQSLPDAPFNLLNLLFPKEPRLLAVCLAIQSAPDLPHTCDDAAALARMSSRSFSRHFLKETGLPYHMWRQRMRLICSLKMLRSGMSVTNVALDIGYATPSAFIYAFGQLFGTSPKQFAGIR
jgi:AraC-like DNA-binding protein